MLHGFTSDHRFPASAHTYARPTHQIIQTMVGAKFLSGFSVPQKPAASVTQNKTTESAWTIERNNRLPIHEKTGDVRRLWLG